MFSHDATLSLMYELPFGLQDRSDLYWVRGMHDICSSRKVDALFKYFDSASLRLEPSNWSY